MDVVFALAYNEGVSPVKVSLRKDVPLAGTPEADAILGIRNEARSDPSTPANGSNVDVRQEKREKA